MAAQHRRICGSGQGLRHHLRHDLSYRRNDKKGHEMRNSISARDRRGEAMWATVVAAAVMFGLPALMVASALVQI
jgi:hypothetical protein